MSALKAVRNAISFLIALIASFVCFAGKAIFALLVLVANGAGEIVFQSIVFVFYAGLGFVVVLLGTVYNELWVAAFGILIWAGYLTWVFKHIGSCLQFVLAFWAWPHYVHSTGGKIVQNEINLTHSSRMAKFYDCCELEDLALETKNYSHYVANLPYLTWAKWMYRWSASIAKRFEYVTEDYSDYMQKRRDEAQKAKSRASSAIRW